MKFEKITENKIRIIVNLKDLEEKNIDLHSFLSNSIEAQSIYAEMLEEAEKTIGFSTKDSKLLIDAMASSEGLFIFTITKVGTKTQNKKRNLKVKRKKSPQDFTKIIYKFNTFEEICDFCTYIQKSNFKNFATIAKNISLYTYKNNYFFIITNVNTKHTKLKQFVASILEFAQIVNNPKTFESKLLEYGTPIMKQNALARCIKHFA